MKIHLIASGDSRLSANQNCWAAQKELEDALASVVSALGHELVRAHPYDEEAKHGFISSQRISRTTNRFVIGDSSLTQLTRSETTCHAGKPLIFTLLAVASCI